MTGGFQMDTLFELWFDVRIKYHWWWIIRYKKVGVRLLAEGEALTSECLLRFTRKIDSHGMSAYQLERQYMSICGIE